jgi:D-hexose-6-phosphate mutarotase
MKDRYFHVKDIDCTITVEYLTRKEMLSWLDEYAENVKSGFGCVSDESYEILYKDGTTDFIDESYDGHKIRRQNIASIVNCNPSTYMVFGHFEMNEYGVAGAAFTDEIDDTNIEEVETECA